MVRVNRPGPDAIAIRGHSRFGKILLVAAWSALVAGLVEGLEFLSFQQLNWLNPSVGQLSVAREILWIAPVFDLALFLAAGLLVAIASAVIPRLPVLPVSFFLFSFLAFFDWIGLPAKLRLSAAVILAAGLATSFTRWAVKRDSAVLVTMRRSLPWAAAAVLLLAGGIELGQRIAEARELAALSPAASGAPNLLIVVMDTVRADHLSAYGYSRATSPNFERLAREGTLFENAISTSSWTLPAHASLLTGRLPHEHGAIHWAYTLHLPNIAEELRRRGFRTGAFSANTLYFTRQKGFGGGFIHFEDVFTSAADMAIRTAYGRLYVWYVVRHTWPGDLPGRKWAENVNANFLRWIDRGPKQPFFVILNYFDAHDPYLPPQPYRSMFSQIPNPGGELNDVFWRMRPRKPEMVQSEMDAYDGGIAYVDAQIGRLMAGLEARGLKQNTLVIILSDHGELFGEHDIYLHRNSLYRPLIRVPMVFYWPGHIPAGVRVSPPVTLASIPATLLDLLGSGTQSLFPFPSLVPLWSGADPARDLPYPISELGWFPRDALAKDPAFLGPTVSVMTSHWQFHKDKKLGTSVFDWTKDSNTLNDLLHSPEGERVAATLERCMRESHAQISAANCPVNPASTAAATRGTWKSPRLAKDVPSD